MNNTFLKSLTGCLFRVRIPNTRLFSFHNPTLVSKIRPRGCLFGSIISIRSLSNSHRCLLEVVNENTIEEVPSNLIPEKTFSQVELREYQKDCIDSIVKRLSEGVNKIAISIATGGGKTVIFTSSIPKILELSRLPSDKASGVLILVHRKELADQAINMVKKLKVVDEDRVYLDMGKFKINPDRCFGVERPFVIVGSVPTLSRNGCERMEKYDSQSIKAVIVDECHHSTSDSYNRIFERLGCSKKNGDTNGPHLLGFTATMSRADRAPLNKVFDEIVYEKHISSLIQENHLCDFDWLRVELGLNLQDVEIRGSDFHLESLSKHINTTEVNIATLKTYMSLLRTKPAQFNSLLVFCVDVAHMRDLSALFRLNGISAQYVSGKTKNSERSKIVNDFKNGDIKVLFNCGVFTEGTDIPNIDSIFLLRPTQSKPLLCQMVGRGLRVHQGKEKLLVVDFVDNQSVGLSVSSTLNGKTDFIKLISGTHSTGMKNRDELLPGEIEYIKFTNIHGMEMLNGEGKGRTSKPYELLKNMRKVNRESFHNSWIQVKFDTWATECGKKSYIKVEITKSGTYCASYCFTKLGFGNKRSNVKNKISIDASFDAIMEEVKKFIDDHENISEATMLLNKREHNMKNQKITPAQLKFIDGIVPSIVAKHKSRALDIDKFMNVYTEKVKHMSRWEAYQLIFGYTISRSNAIMLWLKYEFLNKKENREAITKDSILIEKKELVQGGWM